MIIVDFILTVVSHLKNGEKKNNYNPKVLEHYTNYCKGRDIWNDYVSVTIKDQKFSKNYPNRIIDKKANAHNILRLINIFVFKCVRHLVTCS